MTVDEARKRRDKIEEVKGDDEQAHSLEDSLRADVLRTIIAPGFTNIELARELAGIALSTESIDFARWCA